MAHQDRQKINSWYTDSTYNADESYENSPFATDPRTFPRPASTATSTSNSYPFAMIPLPSQYELHTIEEMRNESVEPCPPAIKRLMQSSILKNEELIEKSLRSISLIRSRLLQQQESNRKKNCEFQQIRSSLDLVRSLVHLIQDETTNKTFVEFSTEDFKILPHGKNFKLLKIEKETATHAITDSLPDTFEPKVPPIQISIGSGSASFSTAKLDRSVRSYKAMSTAANVPTTPTKLNQTAMVGMRNYRQRSEEDLILVSEPQPIEKTSFRDNNLLLKNQVHNYKTQVKKFNPENYRY